MRLQLSSSRKWKVGTGLVAAVALVGIGLALGVPEQQGCGGAAPDDTMAPSAFDDDGDDGVAAGPDGKADGTTSASSYRSGCGAPIRTGEYAIGGDVVTPTGVVTASWVLIKDEKIEQVGAANSKPPTGVPFVATGGVIFPGLIDGHGHVEYNHVALADLGKRYQDRDQWPGASLYQTLVKDPKNAVTKAGLQCEALRHGELRALVGGTTSIQGTPQTSCVRPLVRNLEQTNFCRDKVRQNVTDISGFNRSISGKPSFADSVKSDIAAGKLDAFVVHAGEGIDDHEKAEWGQLKALGLAIRQLVMIHGTAFGQQEWTEAGQAGASLVWSPLSNLLLYGKTTDIPTAWKAGVLVCLGSDWAPSGSANLLGELKVADHVNQKIFGGFLKDEDLVAMVTTHPAAAFRIDDMVGSIAAGKFADLLVVAKQPKVSAYRSLIDARPQDVLLVTISGDPLFGVPATLDALGKKGDYEVIDACGTPRGVDATVEAKDVSEGTESLATVEQKLQTANPKLTPVIDCTNDEALKAYQGTAAQ